MIRKANLAKFAALLALGLGLLMVLAGPEQLLRAIGRKAGANEAGFERPGETVPFGSLVPTGDNALSSVYLAKVSRVNLRFLKTVPGSKSGAKETAAILRAAEGIPAANGVNVLVDTSISVFGSSQDRPMLEIESPRARLMGFDPFSVTDGGGEADGAKRDLSQDATIDLEDAKITCRDDLGRMTPVALRTPHLRVDIRSRDISSFETQDPITFEGEGLRGSGIGLKGYLAMGWFRVVRDVRLELLPGSAQSVKDKLTLRSTGPADVIGIGKYSGRSSALATALVLGAPALAFASGKPIGTTTVTLYENASFRAEPKEGGRFVEIASDRLSMALADAGASRGGFAARGFEAEGNVTFSKERMTGRCVKAVGAFAGPSTLGDLVMDGPYHVELQLPESGGSLPGVGAARTLVVEGRDAAVAKLVDAASGTYSLRGGGRPVATFRGAASPDDASITAEVLEARLAKDGISAFYADGDLVIESASGTLRGETAQLVESGKHPALRVSGPHGATLAATVRSNSSQSGKDHLELTSRSIVMRAASPGATEVVAEGEAIGRLETAAREPVVFSARRLETTLGEGTNGTVELDGKVVVQLPTRNARLRGEHLVIERELSVGTLRGPAATLEWLENDVATRTVVSPEIRFTRETLVATGPVHVTLPAKLVTEREEDAGKTMVLHGSHLESWLDSSGKTTRAVFHGPVTSEGPLEVTGKELTLDFASGRHHLVAREGERTRVAGESARAGMRFRAEAPRFDFERSTETIVMASGGVIEFDGPRKKFDFFSRRKSGGTSDTATMRFETERDIRIDRKQAVFTGSALAKLVAPDGWSLRGDRLTFDFDDKGEPVAVAATGNVRFDVPNEFKGTCDALRYDERTGLLVVTGAPGTPAQLEIAKLGHFEGAALSFNTITYVFETGPGTITGARSH